MISCIFACAEGAKTQSAAVDLSDPIAALFPNRDNDRARAALIAWLAVRSANGRPDSASAADQTQLIPCGQSLAA